MNADEVVKWLEMHPTYIISKREGAKCVEITDGVHCAAGISFLAAVSAMMRGEKPKA